MELSTVSQVIATLGFPIAMCVALFWYMIKQNEQHQSESKEMREAINELKVAIIELKEELTRR